ncbi:hypothetical protein ACSQ67_008585 [Phaseolus vulgaris]
MGRARITLKHISNEEFRKTTFLRRKRGLMKKISEFSKKCGGEHCLIVFDDDNGDVGPMTSPQNPAENRKNMIEAEISEWINELATSSIQLGIQDNAQGFVPNMVMENTIATTSHSNQVNYLQNISQSEVLLDDFSCLIDVPLNSTNELNDLEFEELIMGLSSCDWPYQACDDLVGCSDKVDESVLPSICVEYQGGEDLHVLSPSLDKMGRARITLKHISNEKFRKTTFLRRKRGLMKKISEFSKKCGGEHCLIVFDDDNGDVGPVTSPQNPVEISDIMYPTWDQSMIIMEEDQLRAFCVHVDAKIEACDRGIKLLKDQPQGFGSNMAKENATATTSHPNQGNYLQSISQSEALLDYFSSPVDVPLNSTNELSDLEFEELIMGLNSCDWPYQACDDLVGCSNEVVEYQGAANLHALPPSLDVIDYLPVPALGIIPDGVVLGKLLLDPEHNFLAKKERANEEDLSNFPRSVVLNTRLIVFDDDNGDVGPMTSPQNPVEVHSMIQKYYESQIKNERPHKTYGIEEFIENRKNMIETEISKVDKHISKHQISNLGSKYDNHGRGSIEGLCAHVDAKIEACDRGIKLLKDQPQGFVSNMARENVVATTSHPTQTNYLQNISQSETLLDDFLKQLNDKSYGMVDFSSPVDVPLNSTNELSDSEFEELMMELSSRDWPYQACDDLVGCNNKVDESVLPSICVEYQGGGDLHALPPSLDVSDDYCNMFFLNV